MFSSKPYFSQSDLSKKGNRRKPTLLPACGWQALLINNGKMSLYIILRISCLTNSICEYYIV